MQNRLVIFLITFLITVSVSARENSSVLYNKGEALALNGEIDKAIVIFKKVVKISPYYCLGHYGLGKCYLYQYGMLNEAVKHLKLSVSYDRKFIKGYYYLGLAYMFSEKYKLAINSFNQAYSYDNTYLESLYNISIIYDIMGNDYKSARYLMKYFNKKSEDEDDIIF